MGKQDGQEYLDGLHPSVAEFIRQVIKEMHCRKAACQDARSGLVAYFEDELRDCPTDNDRERKAQRLIGECGDPRLLAILFQRVKRHRRAIWLTAVVRALQVFAVLLVSLVLYASWFATGKATPNIDYTALLNRMSYPKIRDEDNAWANYEKAIALYVEPNDGLAEALSEFRWVQPLYVSLSDFPDSNRAELIEWVSLNEAALAEFTAGSSKPYCHREYAFEPNNNEERWLFNIPLPHMTSFRDIGRLVLWDARIAVSRGEIRRALDDCLSMARSGAHLACRSTVLEQLVGLHLTKEACFQIAKILDAAEPGAAMLEELRQHLVDILPDDDPLVSAEGERLVCFDMVQRVFTLGGRGGGHMVPGRWHELNYVYHEGIEDREFGILEYSGYCLSSMRHAGRDLTVEKANEIFDRADEVAKLTPFERRAGKIESPGDVLWSLPEHRFYLFHLVLPAFRRIAEIGDEAKAIHEATLTIVALECWRMEKGGYPASLSLLVEEGYVAKMPMDPYSDKPLVYKKTDGSFTLYSLSENFEDDAGEPARRYYRSDEGGVEMISWPADGYEERAEHWLGEGDTVFWPLRCARS